MQLMRPVLTAHSGRKSKDAHQFASGIKASYRVLLPELQVEVEANETTACNNFCSPDLLSDPHRSREKADPDYRRDSG